MAVNLSPVQVRDPRLVDLLSAVLDDTKIAPSRVVLEMTEKILVAHCWDFDSQVWDRGKAILRLR